MATVLPSRCNYPIFPDEFDVGKMIGFEADSQDRILAMSSGQKDGFY